MTGPAERPWVEIPVPEYTPPRDPDDWKKPKTRGDKDYDETLDEEKRVIIIDL